MQVSCLFVLLIVVVLGVVGLAGSLFDGLTDTLGMIVGNPGFIAVAFIVWGLVAGIAGAKAGWLLALVGVAFAFILFVVGVIMGNPLAGLFPALCN